MPSRNELQLARCPNPSRFKQGPLVSGDGKLLAVAGNNSGLVIHDVATGKRVQEFAGHVGGCYELSPDGRAEGLFARALGRVVKLLRLKLPPQIWLVLKSLSWTTRQQIKARAIAGGRFHECI